MEPKPVQDRFAGGSAAGEANPQASKSTKTAEAIAPSGIGFSDPPEAPQAGRASLAGASTSSANEFHAPQSGHFPSHFAA